MVIIHEHWYRYFIGKDMFLDAQFFYPYDRSFSLTDVFLLSGLTHSLLRVVGLDVIDAWNYSQIIWTAIGLFGWFLFGLKILTSRFLQIMLVPLIGTSFAFIAHLNERPNVIPYLLISYILLFIKIIFDKKYSSLVRTMNLGLVLISLPLLVLTSWYPGFFLIIFLLLLISILLFLSPAFQKMLKETLAVINLVILTPFVFLSLMLTILWAYIYIPVLNSVASFRRPIEEVRCGSPFFREIFSTNALGGPKVSLNEQITFSYGDEELIGFSLILLMIFAVLFLIYVFQNLHTLRRLESTILISVVSIIILFETLIIKFFGDNSIYIFAWNNISFLKSIRTPVRWHIVATFLIILIILYILDKIQIKKQFGKTLLIAIVPITIFLDQFREAPGIWQKSDFIDQSLLSYDKHLSNCSAFVLDRPDVGMWKDIIEAMILTIYVDKPTVNGYSGGFPATYPPIDWYGDGELNAIGQWLEDNGAIEDVCLLDGINFAEPLSYNREELFLTLGNGFSGFETNGKDEWFWSEWSSSSFYIYNLTKLTKNIQLKFDLNTPVCLSDAQLILESPKFSESVNFKNTNSSTFSKTLDIPAWDRMAVKISSGSDYCSFPDDPRNLYFSVKNIEFITEN